MVAKMADLGTHSDIAFRACSERRGASLAGPYDVKSEQDRSPRGTGHAAQRYHAGKQRPQHCDASGSNATQLGQTNDLLLAESEEAAGIINKALHGKGVGTIESSEVAQGLEQGEDFATALSLLETARSFIQIR